MPFPWMPRVERLSPELRAKVEARAGEIQAQVAKALEERAARRKLKEEQAAQSKLAAQTGGCEKGATSDDPTSGNWFAL